MSVPTPMLPTKRASSRVVLHTVGPAARLKEACTALASLGFTIVPVADVTSPDSLWTAGVGDAASVTLTMLPDDALVPAAAAVSHLLGSPQAGQVLAGARGKEGLSQRQLAALTGFPSGISPRWNTASGPWESACQTPGQGAERGLSGVVVVWQGTAGPCQLLIAHFRMSLPFC